MNRIPPVTRNLLIANIIVFLLQNFLNFRFGDGFSEYFGALFKWDSLSPWEPGNFRVWQLITHMFMHGGILHLAFNMFGLWMFGSVLEGRWGQKRFFEFYMICGIVAALSHLLLSSGYGYAVGASGAVMGVLAAFAYLYPDVELYFMFVPIPVKAKWAIPILIAIDLFGSIANIPQDNIAHFAHLGGAFAGLTMVYFWKRSGRRRNY